MAMTTSHDVYTQLQLLAHNSRLEQEKLSNSTPYRVRLQRVDDWRMHFGYPEGRLDNLGKNTQYQWNLVKEIDRSTAHD